MCFILFIYTISVYNNLQIFFYSSITRYVVRKVANLRIWLKTLRENKNMTQKDMAKNFGIAPTTYAALEHGERQKDMSISIASKIADFFNISLSKIRDYEEAITATNKSNSKKKSA